MSKQHNIETTTYCNLMEVKGKDEKSIFNYFNDSLGSLGSVAKLPSELVEDGACTIEELTALQSRLEKIADFYNPEGNKL